MPRRATKSAASFQFKNFVPYKARRGEGYMNERQHDHFKYPFSVMVFGTKEP